MKAGEYEAILRELNRQVAEAMGVKKEQMARDAMNNHTSTNGPHPDSVKHHGGGFKSHGMRVLNPGFKATPHPKPRGVSIQPNVIRNNTFEVMMPNGYYLADETGLACNIGGSYDAGPEFKTVEEALAKFVKVAENFKRFYP